MRNAEIAWALYQIADLLDFKGEEFFKTRAYRRAARAIIGLDRPVADLYASGELKNVPNLGKNIIAKIGEMLSTGECSLHRELKQQIPVTVLDLMALPGLGPKRAKMLYEQLGVTSIDELEQAARGRKVRGLPGMGVKTEINIIHHIGLLKKKAHSLPLGAARELAAQLGEYLEQLAAVRKSTVAGDIRRWAEVVYSVDFIVLADHMEEAGDIIESFITHPVLGEVLWREPDRVRTTSRWGVPVELVVVTRERYWPALLWATGSRSHVRRLQLRAWKRGWRLDAHRLVSRSDGQAARVDSEEAIYRLLGLQYVVPELRENNGEISAAAGDRLPRLLDLEDIRGDLHMHTKWSDGLGSIEEMARRAREKGYSYIAVTDHSPSLKIARGLSPERLLAQFERISALNEQWDDFHILTGVEVDILADGKLDHMDEVLARANVVIASVHSGFKQDRDTITRRIKAAIENEHVNIIGHPTGRLLGYRESYAVDVEEIIETAARYNKVLEINSSPDRLDLNDYYVQLARESGVCIAINTDAHDLRRMDEIIYGVSVARRAWLEPRHVINTLPLPELLQVLRGESRV
ncbi:DNA polymerase/3'-5' exonuclease PolX [Desulfallas thermosapovorans]|uniref:DNA polymerase beta n=1 Tax=Desulfallas thermosapovorans DSM 6562 TaxID=1121431 RepID=A0A5S4ZP67_9FIRM|nr:DNA polymerase/3'-5' exonuclease PolX [Desulfallas thermosapovorans]TYO94559.1 DNA polymerase (family 10) [Desulfallas thermosapovorans DSM 6562]